MNKIKKISEHSQVIEKQGKQRVPVKLHVSEELMPDEDTIDQLVNVASQPHVFKHVAALTDVHQKPGRLNPSGSVVATEKYFLPQLLDTAPNCGMRLIKTSFGEGDLDEKQLDSLFKELVEVIPTKTYLGTFFSRRTILEVSKRGAIGVLEALKEDVSEADNIMQGGSMFGDEKISDKDLFDAIPRMFFRFAQLRLGILGVAGNHFLDLMKITDIMEEDLAKKFGLKKGQYVFMMHTGSGLFGQYASYFYTPKKKEHLSQRLVLEAARLTFLNDKVEWHKQLEIEIPRYRDSKNVFPIDSESELGKNYYIAHRAAGNHGFANRSVLQHHLRKALKKTLKKDPGLDLLYDMSHVFAAKENHFGKDVIVHRSNATRANGPSRMKGTQFEKTGEPVFMPSSMSTEAYFGVATDNNESTFFSAAHGTGKSKTKTSEVPSDKDELMKKMKKRNVKLYNAQSAEIVNQDAAHYKDPGVAIEGMKANGVMRPIAKMMPVSVLMA
ncbi:MAG: RtcB family protein [Patescibacteria group bacterium]|nr:RtcB family protein [Patescibacteria group bacterium]